jgi:hypothetical protein
VKSTKEALCAPTCSSSVDTPVGCSSLSYDCGAAFQGCQNQLNQACNDSCNAGCVNQTPISCSWLDDSDCLCTASAQKYGTIQPNYCPPTPICVPGGFCTGMYPGECCAGESCDSVLHLCGSAAAPPPPPVGTPTTSYVEECEYECESDGMVCDPNSCTCVS